MPWNVAWAVRAGGEAGEAGELLLVSGLDAVACVGRVVRPLPWGTLDHSALVNPATSSSKGR